MSMRPLKAGAIALLAHALGAQAATYYVHPTAGSDNNNGTLLPFKTLAKAQSKAVAGDTIRLASGKTFEEPLIVRSGVAYNSYALLTKSPAPALISGRRQVDVSNTAWSRHPNLPIYSTTLSATLSGPVTQVLLGNLRLTRARVPNVGQGEFGVGSNQFAKVTQDGDHLTLNIASGIVPAGADTAGATAMIRLRGSDLNEYTVNGWKPGSASSLDVKALSFTPDWYIAHEYTIPAGHGYWLENKLWMLDSAGEWYHDPVTRRLHVWMPNGQTPQGQGIHVSVMPHGIVAKNVSNASITNIQVADTSSDGISMVDTSNIKLDNVTVLRAGGRGIAMTGSIDNAIDAATVDGSSLDGIWMGYVATSFTPSAPRTIVRSVNVNVTNSTIRDSGRRGFSQTAVRLGEGGQFINNRIENTPNVGLFAALNTRIENNLILNSCALSEDCGGIYVAQPPDDATQVAAAAPATPVTRTKVSNNLQIINNIVDGGSGSADGVPTGAGTDTRGIYLDDYVNGVTLSGNFAAGMKHGYMLHTAFNNVLSDNIAIGNRSHNIFLQEDAVPSKDGATWVRGEMRQNSITGNAMVASRSSTSPGLAIPNILHTAEGGQGQTRQFATYDRNRYATLNPNASTILAYNYGQDNPVQDMDLATWRGIGNDVNGSLRAYRSDIEAHGFYNSASSGDLSIACPSTVSANCSQFVNLKTGAAVRFPLNLAPKSAIIVVR